MGGTIVGKWVLVILSLLLAILVAFGIFVGTGVIDGSALLWKLGPKISWLEPHLETYSQGQAGELWFAQKEEEYEAQLNELKQFEEDLAQKNKALDQRALDLDRRENRLLEAQTKFETEEEHLFNINTLAELYTEMSVDEASRILTDIDQTLLLNILLRMDKRDAANILAKLPTDLAVTLSKNLGEASK